MNRWSLGLRRGAVFATAAGLVLAMACSGGSPAGGDADAGDVPGDDVPADPGADVPDAADADRDGADATDMAPDPTPPDVPDPAVEELVAQGKERLSAGESLSAMDSFDRALVLSPGHPDATWGMVLARLQTSVATFSSLPGLANYKEDPDAVPPPAAMHLALAWPDHGGTLGASIDGLHLAAAEQQRRLEALMALPGTAFRLPGGLPLAFADHPMMALCCDWDLGDLHAISSFNHLLLAFVGLLGSQRTDANLADLEDVLKDSPGIEQMLAGLLDGHPGIFTLLPGGDGEAIWRSVKDHLLASTADALEAVRLMGEGGGGDAPVATLSGTQGPYLVLHGTFPDGSDRLEVLWDGTSASLKRAVERAHANLSGEPDALLGLESDALVSVGVLLDIVNRTVGLETVIASLGFDLPDILTGLLGSLDKDDPEQLAGLLGTLTPLLGIQPGTVFLDLGGFLSNPYNLRDLFPNHVREPGSAHRAFTRSFECVKGGTRVDPAGEAQALVIFLQDPSLAGTEAGVTVRSFASADLSGEPSDQEEVPLDPVAGFGGLFTASVPLAPDAAPVFNDLDLAVPTGGSIRVEYRSPEVEGREFAFGGSLADGVLPWDYGASCSADAPAWDADHFRQPEFADAVEVPAPGQQVPLQPLAADGKASRAPLMAFRSPSFNHLLWIQDGGTPAEATQGSFSTLFAGVMAALEDF